MEIRHINISGLGARTWTGRDPGRTALLLLLLILLPFLSVLLLCSSLCSFVSSLFRSGLLCVYSAPSPGRTLSVLSVCHHSIPRVCSLDWITQSCVPELESCSSINCPLQPETITGLLTFLSASSSSWLFALSGPHPTSVPRLRSSLVWLPPPLVHFPYLPSFYFYSLSLSLSIHPPSSSSLLPPLSSLPLYLSLPLPPLSSPLQSRLVSTLPRPSHPPSRVGGCG
ncbi:hypothetical protein BDW71DRAFT_65732 [Aspergillus fruticulosus]